MATFTRTTVLGKPQLPPVIYHSRVQIPFTRIKVIPVLIKSTPSIKNINPPINTQIGVSDHISLDLTDPHGFKYISIKTIGPDGKPELIYDGVFTTQFTGSTVSTATNGLHFDIVRSGGWLVPPNLTIVAINNDGVAL